ncbi:MAG: flagellar type III secretion system pore protein FliP [Candidatus Aureabacteria bacterium]|nr:flagellar type III secretion system pore protein FliP [Candidatus Auribacterota bacterium]
MSSFQRHTVCNRYPFQGIFYMISLLLLLFLCDSSLFAQAETAATGATPFPFSLNIGLEHTEDPKQIAKSIQIVILLTVLGLVPSFLVMVTSFTRITVILNFLKRAAGIGQQPSSQVIAGLGLFLTCYVMAPVGIEMNENAIKPYMNGDISQSEALTKLLKPLRKFMFKYTSKKDIALFVKVAKIEKPKNQDEVPTYLLIPAYIISELKTSFQIGFLLFLPFLIIDMVVASILLSMGMIVLPPVTISTPFKILLFVMVDGWHLIIRAITMGFY